MEAGIDGTFAGVTAGVDTKDSSQYNQEAISSFKQATSSGQQEESYIGGNAFVKGDVAKWREGLDVTNALPVARDRDSSEFEVISELLNSRSATAGGPCAVCSRTLTAQSAYL